MKLRDIGENVNKSEYNKKYYAEHKDEIYKKRSLNRDHWNKKQAEWAAKNPEKVGIGHLGDSADTVFRAFLYLERYL